jgi:hypothetical protein
VSREPVDGALAGGWRGAAIEVGGSQDHTLNDVVRMVGQATGKECAARAMCPCRCCVLRPSLCALSTRRWPDFATAAATMDTTDMTGPVLPAGPEAPSGQHLPHGPGAVFADCRMI